MSRAAEEQAERWFAQNAIDCAANFVVGAKVWRERYDKIQEGVVVTVSRCRYDRHGDPVECADGDKPLYTAKFGGTNEFNGDYESQTWEWKFFSKPEFARHCLIEQVQGRVIEHRRDIEKLETLVRTLTEQGAIDVEASPDKLRADLGAAP